jgi:preprotein translocase subunit SecE
LSVRASSVDPASPTPAGSQSSAESRPVQSAAEDPELGQADSLDPDARTGFLAGTLAELGKVVWPSRQQLFSESVAVILMVALSAAAIAAIDRFYGWLSHLVFR